VSLNQLKKEAVALTPQERLELAAFLVDLEEQSESDFQKTVDQRMNAMDSGKKVSSQQFEAEHRRRAKT